MTLSSPIKWHGGKHYLAPKMMSFLPAHTHRVYTHAGGISELFAWPCEGVSEVVNDRDLELTNFWRVISCEYSFPVFRRIIEATPFSENEFEYSRNEEGEIQKAAAFFVRCRQSRQGLMKDFATLSRNRVRRGMNEQVSAWLTAIEGLPEVHERLKRVVILNRDALVVIQQQDSANTLFYCDPPYLHETRSATDSYQHEMTKEDHMSLLNQLAHVEGKFMLSGYPSPMYDAAESMYGWNHVDFDLPNNASSSKTKERKIERVWMNFETKEISQ